MLGEEGYVLATLQTAIEFLVHEAPATQDELQEQQNPPAG